MRQGKDTSMGSATWADYDSGYRRALGDSSFLEWRAAGARQKALNIVRVSRGVSVSAVLEIGCGTGAVLEELESMGFAEKYVASDVSIEAVEFVRRTCGKFLNGAFVASAGSLPFPDKQFSIAILSHVVEHLDDPVSAVRDAARIAEYTVIEVPTERVFSNFVRRRILGQPFASAAAAGHVQFWSPRSITHFLEQACGLEIVARHKDFLCPQLEFHGRKGARKAKPFIKEALKRVIPGWIYVQLLTTHATFLCRERAREGNQASAATSSRWQGRL
ncbi:MAG TPA: class I SAM-dependent methyltransferase [Candidatus Acidoferrum sp.]|nr:class I SAM-dependent methyltransferase [Candidatus Acidoferrum sp.]